MAQDNTTSIFESYRDKKLASWAIYQPRVTGISAPYWMGSTGSYGRKVTILAATKESLIGKIEEYAASHKRVISASEADTMRMYGMYVLGGGIVVGVIGHMTSVSWAKSTGASAAIGGSAAIATSFFVKPKQTEDDEIVVDTSMPQMPQLGQGKLSPLPNVPIVSGMRR